MFGRSPQLLCEAFRNRARQLLMAAQKIEEEDDRERVGEETETAGETEPEQSCRSRWCQPQGSEGLCRTAVWESAAPLQP